MSTTSDRRFAARVFAVVAGTLLGIGLALGLYGLQLPARGPVESFVALVYMVVGAVVTLGGSVLALTSVAMRRAHRIGHLFGWVLVPTLVAFGACWAWLLHAPPHL